MKWRYTAVSLLQPSALVQSHLAQGLQNIHIGENTAPVLLIVPTLADRRNHLVHVPLKESVVKATGRGPILVRQEVVGILQLRRAKRRVKLISYGTGKPSVQPSFALRSILPLPNPRWGQECIPEKKHAPQGWCSDEQCCEGSLCPSAYIP